MMERLFLCQGEKRGVLWVMGGVFAVIILVQYFELPYGPFIWSLFPSGFSGLSSHNTTQLNSTATFDCDCDDSGFSFESNNTGNHEHKPSIQPSNDTSGVEFLKPNNNLAPERATGFQHRKDDIVPPSPSGALPETTMIAPLTSNATLHLTISPAPAVSRNDLGLSRNNSPIVKEVSRKPVEGVVSITEMTNMLLQGHLSDLLTKPMWSSASDEELLTAKSQIESASNIISDLSLNAKVYHNVSKFIRSYELMEQNLKVYIYREGKKPVFHQPRLTGIYSSEGWFMKQLQASQLFLTTDPNKAHLFYLPFSSQNLEEVVYVPGSHSFNALKAYLNNYVDFIKAKYPFWNRTQGADHFLVACHDWAPEETRHVMKNCIKSLCNADLKEGFVLGRDASLPETNILSADPSRGLGGNRSSQRKFLAFFAGSMHGYVRPILLKYWQNKDPSMKIFGKMRKNDYIHHMKTSKYCICARGFEVNSPRVVEAISYECVPVIISDNFVPPFLETLNWESFAVFVKEKDIPNLKSILESISLRRYVELRNNVKKVQQHFIWHPEPVKYDIFHMILHSIWYNRVFQMGSS